MEKFIKVIVIIGITISLISIIVKSDKKEYNRLKNNQEILLLEKDNGHYYKVYDSISAIKVSELQLKLSEYKKYRKNDLELIKQLKIDKSNLQKVISSNVETINSLSIKLNDSIRIDTITNAIDTIKQFVYKSKWIDVNGKIEKDTVELNINNRESLKIVEEVKYKRFLGFLWKTNKVKNRYVNVISENPATSIIKVDFISISGKQ